MKDIFYTGYNNIKYAAILLLSDTLSYFLGLVCAYYSRIYLEDPFNLVELQFDLHYFVFELWWVYLLFIIILFSLLLYRKRMPFWRELKLLVKGSTIAFILSFSTISLAKMSEDISRLTILLLWLYSTLFLMIFRYLIKVKFYKYTSLLENTLIIGSIKEIPEILKALSNENSLGFNIVGIVTIIDEKSNSNYPYKVLGTIKDIKSIINRKNVTAAIFLPNLNHMKHISKIIGRLQLILSRILIVQGREGLSFSNAVAMQTLMTQLLFLEIENNLSSPLNRLLKVFLDIFIALTVIPIVLPMIVIISIIIKLTSEGSIFFSHERVGVNGKVIKILKFRSMYKDAGERLKEILASDKSARIEWEASYKLKNDPRVTSIGKVLRKTSLDELPQIFNVIKGDMSFIGPRPVLKKELITYYKDYSSYYLMVKPGITGLWQISGRSDTGYEYRVSRDVWYVLNWSIWLDIVILLKTPAVVLKREGAY